ncbi:ankyrin repeat-containing domain protein [Talaromyces proteolyticus]|uniref:Ankyrin repeat-containing domain protein n=1 Tax=Talaromyces proteolyticus TaxID=1131652 RepID=A0AAD4KI46_9EURO|nr:ankyrin repeat-containing domain protein [Talaromyces proteolyticus]KAH8692176.1 ankyrin repeat-containing domain protein [Talaromyces proteolyticus]
MLRFYNNPFPDPSDYPTASTLPPTAIKALLDLGADPLATDNKGKHVLHHLLEAEDRDRTPIIRQSLRYLASHFPTLVNQPDSNGMYPLHTAMQRVRRLRDGGRIEITDPEFSVADLIAAGANPHVRDAHGNNVLHYIADLGDMLTNSGLTEIDMTFSGEWSATIGCPAAARRLFDILLDQGVDVKARNDAGQTPMRILLDSGGAWMAKRGRWRGASSIYSSMEIEKLADETEAKVFDKFGVAGVDWNERDEQGRTLLHAVAAHDNRRTVWRCKYLRDRGVDPLIRDMYGKTAVDLAWGVDRVVEALQDNDAKD